MAAVPTPIMDRPKPSRLRRSVRWSRRVLLLLFFLLLYGGVHLNQIGLPEFLKRPLLDQLRARGLSLDFSRLRVRLGRGLIGEKVTIDRLGEQAGEHFFADEVQIRLDWAPLLQLEAPVVRALKVREGLIQVPVPAGDGTPPYLFKVTDVSGVLLFLGPEEWELQSLEASSLRSRFRAFGTLTNASVLRRTRPVPTKPVSQAWKRQLRRLGDLLDQAEFTEAPVLTISFNVDLRAPHRSVAEVELQAKGVRHLELSFQDLLATAHFNESPSTNGSLPFSVRLEAPKVASRWAKVSEFSWQASGAFSTNNILPDQVDWSAGAQDVETRWASAQKLAISGKTLATLQGLHSTVTVDAWKALSIATNVSSISAGHLHTRLLAHHSRSNWISALADLTGEDILSPWANLGAFSLRMDARRLDPPLASPTLEAFWRHLSTVELHTRVGASNILARLPQRSTDISASHLSSMLSWSPDHGGMLTVSNLSATTPAGSLKIQGDVNARTRRTQASFDAKLDLQAYLPLLTPAAQHWMSQYGWPSNHPPHLTGAIAVTLPAWTNRQPDWRGEVVPTLTLAGSVSGDQFTFRGIPGDSAQGQFTYTNRVWHIPALTAHRPEGSVTFSYLGHELTREYHFRVHSTVDPLIVRPLIEGERAQQAFNDIQLPIPPVLNADVWGVWKDRQRSGFDVRLSATNVGLRGDTIESVSGRVQFTNSMVRFSDVALVSRGTASIPGGAFDIATQRLSFTNTRTLLDPLRVARVIGTKSARVMSNYLFAVPPAVTLNGVIGLGTNAAATDLRVVASAPQFRWWRLDLNQADARLHFLGESLALNDLRSRFHGGWAAGDLYFDWSSSIPGSFVRGEVQITNLVLEALMPSLGSKSNRLEGVLHGAASFKGVSSDTNSWSGSGIISMRDGYLWDLPMFGIFSKLFDAVSPGLGQARFSEGQMTFQVTNSILRTQDLSVRSPAMRLSYRGAVDLASRLDARMEAELFRDTPLIGPLISFVLTPLSKLFIYDVKGTLKKPVAEPRYVPKLLLAPLRPLKTLRDLLPKDDASDAPLPPPPAR